MEFGRKAFGQALERPSVCAFWWPRFERIAALVRREGDGTAGRCSPSSFAEAKGELLIDAAGLPALHPARPRPIASTASPRAGSSIIDYKTGGAAQLTGRSEPAMPRNCRWRRPMARGRRLRRRSGEAVTAELAYWHLRGGREIGDILTVPADPMILAAAAIARGSKQLIADIRGSGHALSAACPIPISFPPLGLYDHLSRRGEWTRGAAMSADDVCERADGRGGAPARGRVPAQAAEPSDSVWVAASAGTGKTTVLTDRCLRLLLAGSPAGASALPHLHQGGGGGDGQSHRRAPGALGDHGGRAAGEDAGRACSARRRATRSASWRAALRPRPRYAGRLRIHDHPRLLPVAAAPLSPRGGRSRRISSCSTIARSEELLAEARDGMLAGRRRGRERAARRGADHRQRQGERAGFRRSAARAHPRPRPDRNAAASARAGSMRR